MDAPTLRRKAMDLLARREHSRRELRERLSRGVPQDSLDLVEQVLDSLAEEGLQSDQRMAESFIRYQADRGQGPMKIRAALRSRGIGDEVAGLAFDELDLDWHDRVASVATRRFGNEPPKDQRERGKRARFLAQRGFTYDQIGELL